MLQFCLSLELSRPAADVEVDWQWMPDVPFLCEFRRASDGSPVDLYGEIVRYLKAHRGRACQQRRQLAWLGDTLDA